MKKKTKLTFWTLFRGTFALYSLLCRHAKVKTIPNQHRTDEELTTYSRSTFHELSLAAKTKRWLEANTFRKNALLILVLVGTCMVVEDGILTPAISGTNAHPIVEESIRQSSKQFSIDDLKKKATIGIVLRLKTH
ncbi:potassium transporter 10-like isoform X1 [Olea europaea subsp. europaea]|uniref:Potassium transporter 10-like isoform X1 n=1 Tax=Olea europaea subsp. europaea TaxID=158383 RepID=A0A8S0QFJ7_OLEEU|nr:potassium transporter 10-like isoform X1 [Olea europaea subsp. europaea]